MVMPLSISTGPALPDSDNAALDSESKGLVMEFCRMVKRFFSYGVVRRLGKVLAMVVCLTGPAFAEEVTLLAFGDSLTQGYGLPEADGFVPQLQRWLEAEGEEVRLINAGVSGDTTAGGAARIDWSLAEDVDAMILTLGGNDLLRGVDPSVTRENLDQIIQTAQARQVDVLLVGMLASKNYGSEYKAAFDAIYPDLAALYDMTFFPYFFQGLVEGGPAEMQPYFQRDGIHPNAEGVARIVAALGPAVQELIAQAR
jgi:acyl-CoA thioesterase-1